MNSFEWIRKLKEKKTGEIDGAKESCLHALLSPAPLKGTEDLENRLKPGKRFTGPENWYEALK